MKPQRKIKRMSWAPESSLCQVKLFLSEDCPSEVSKKHQYHLQSNTLLTWPSTTDEYDDKGDDLPPGFEYNQLQNRSKAESYHTSQIKWECPPSFALSFNWGVEAGEESKEKYVLEQREKHVLEAIYPRNSDIPPSPHVSVEVEMESYDDSLTPLIPIEGEMQEESIGQTSSTLATNYEAAIVSAFATIIAAILKGNDEEENKIDADFLLEIVKDPIMVEKIAEKYKAAMTATSSRTVSIPTSYYEPATSSVPLSLPNPTTTSLDKPATATATATESTQPAASHDSVTRPRSPTPSPSPQRGVKRGASPESERRSVSRKERSDAGSSGSSKSGVVKDVDYYKRLVRTHSFKRRDMQSRNNHSRDSKRSRSNSSKRGVSEKSKIQKPCIYFKSSKGCRSGSNCPFLHDPLVWRM